MKILHILKSDDKIARKIIDAQSKENDVTVVELDGAVDYGSLVKTIFECDRVFCW